LIKNESKNIHTPALPENRSFSICIFKYQRPNFLVEVENLRNNVSNVQDVRFSFYLVRSTGNFREKIPAPHQFKPAAYEFKKYKNISDILFQIWKEVSFFKIFWWKIFLEFF